MVAGLVVPLAGQGIAVWASMAVAIANGGGPNADLDAGEKFGVLVPSVLAYGSAELMLLGICVALPLTLSLFLRSRASSGLVVGLAAGRVFGLAAGMLYQCGGFGL
ncbi:hypothetical protein Raf01_02300 [Rugosimonospora africana]|uniref:Uncharacterized protein n=2 Tax=Rugosimonospora africana TaxID=556532 RepID=A0A8J3VNC2_9ACTN|nr:hypothetical protein Raf01_02300 [Rugosimonospora africana]